MALGLNRCKINNNNNNIDILNNCIIAIGAIVVVDSI